ncbi:helix-turn-helix domain-containing protein [Streptomyces sp. MJM1172]|uniref:helix-turn-helix domain-containing protein n=1 Tax=Streptomyces sp. MJM1172 TaxID=1703926 RepID=UPI0009A14D18|nr:Scr1 family TA system antitoxin-like transcriptional regulator [Streptomyces sp. MJM1172]
MSEFKGGDCPLGTAPLPKIRTSAHFFAEELVLRREQAGMKQAELARRAKMSPSRVNQIEKATVPPTLDNARDLDRALGDPAPGFFERLWLWAHSTPAMPDWFGRYLEFERRAVSVREYAATTVPGILQTEEYTRALLREGMVGASSDDIEETVAMRLDRQEILHRDDRPPLWYILDGAILTRPVGGPAVMARQLEHILNLSASGAVVVQVLPVGIGAHAMLGGLLALLALPDGPSVAYLEGSDLGQLVEDATRVAQYGFIYDRVQTRALSLAESAEAIRSAMEDMHKMSTEQHDLTGAEYRTSTYSSNQQGQCVAVALTVPGIVPVKDTKDLSREPVCASPEAWGAFVASL